jgi:protocatechuate 3,4-dioxygenase beta subunit
MAGPDGQYTDDYRATQLVGEDGAYRFESNFPPPYSGRPPHIHVRVSAEGYQTLITQHYPQKGVTSADLDLVLVPQP